MQTPALDPEPELPITPRGESPQGEKKPSTFDVPKRWFAEYRKDVLLITIAIGSPLLSLWFVHKTIDDLKRSMWVWHLDSSGVMTYAPIALADPDSEIFKEIVMQATEVYLKRNPAGISNKELLPRYFSEASLKAIEAEVSKAAPERMRRNLFDQPEIKDRPTRLDVSGGAFRYRVVGFIVRTGVIDGVNERLVGDFKIGLVLVPNDDVRQKGRFPYIVKQYRKEITWRNIEGPDAHEVYESALLK